MFGTSNMYFRKKKPNSATLTARAVTMRRIAKRRERSTILREVETHAAPDLTLILHVGYAFVPFGFLLHAAAVFGTVPSSAGIHAWMAGAAGVMTLAVMTRATLGHTGQRLTASVATQVIYAAVIVGALARICAAVSPAHSEPLLHVAAFGWVAAFLGFALAFGPLLVGSRWRALAIPRAMASAR